MLDDDGQVQPGTEDVEDTQPTDQDTTPEGQDGTTDTAATDAGTAPPPRKWAGMYDSPEQLEEAYAHSVRKMHEATQEAAALRRKQEGPAEAPATDPLEQLIVDNWGDDPAMKAILSNQRRLEAELARARANEGRKYAEETVGSVRGFLQSNPELIKNADLGTKFVEDLNDRLPPGVDFNSLMAAANAGSEIPEWLAKDLPKKMAAALKATTGGTTAKIEEKKAAADKRSQDRLGTLPPPARSQVAATAPSGSWKEAFSACRRAASKSD